MTCNRNLQPELYILRVICNLRLLPGLQMIFFALAMRTHIVFLRAWSENLFNESCCVNIIMLYF